MIVDEFLVRRQLRQFLDNNISYKTFFAWMTIVPWDVNEYGSDSLKALVHGILLRLDEYTDGHWSEEELREKLSEYWQSDDLSWETRAKTMLKMPGS